MHLHDRQPHISPDFQTSHGPLPATRVRTISGQVYGLKPEDVRLLRQQQDLSFPEAKIILGQGGYGKVRLARNVDTGEFVAVKKFEMQRSAPFKYANKEASHFEDIQNAAQSRQNTHPVLLDTMLDLAHVSIPSQIGGNPKSYLFTPLANMGDGSAMQTNSFVDAYSGGTLDHMPPEAIRMDENNISPYAYHAEKHDLFGLGLCLLELKLGQNPRQQCTAPHLQLRYQDGTHKAVTLSFNKVNSSCQGVADDLLHNLAPNHIDNQIALLLAHNPELRPSAQHVQAVLSKEII